jgi:hypothetical protein
VPGGNETEIDLSKYDVFVEYVTREDFAHPEWYEEVSSI